LTIFNTADPRDIPAYSISEAAHYLGVPTSTLRSWFAGQAYAHRGERDAKGVPIKLYPFMRSQPPREQPRTVVIDPRVSFGRPVVAGTGIPTAVLAEQFKAGDSVPVLAKDYGASEEAVWDAMLSF